MPEWGVIETGFRRKTYADALADMQARAKTNFGESINTDTDKPLGKILDIVAWQFHEMWQEGEDVYNAIAVDTAEGIALDRLVKYKGLKRQQEATGSGQLQVTGTQGTLVPLNFIAAKNNGITYFTTTSATIPVGGVVNVSIQCTTAGSRGNAEIGEVNTIITPITGITSVTNPQVIVNGADLESDTTLRERYLTTVGGLSTVEAIRAAVAAVPGVISNVVVENVTMAANENGSPKSVHSYVYGGDDTAIAQAIFDSKAGGIEAYGTTTTIVITDANGFDHNIGFSRAEVVQIWVKVDVVTNQFFIVNGTEVIQGIVIGYIGGEAHDGSIQKGLRIGENVISSKIASLVWILSGLEDVHVQVSTDGTTWSDGNIAIGSLQIARTAIAQIEVNIT